MRDGTKKLNLGLTIISMMVMILAGASVLKIQTVKGYENEVSFSIIPQDWETDDTVYNCEALVTCIDLPESSVNYQADGQGYILIDSDLFSWDISEHPEISIYISDPLDLILFENDFKIVTPTMDQLTFPITGSNIAVYEEDDRIYTCFGSCHDSVFPSSSNGFPDDLTYIGGNGEAYFDLRYGCYLTAADHVNYHVKMVVDYWYFEAYDWIQAQKGPQEAYVSYPDDVELEIDNTGGDADDASWEPPNHMIIQFVRSLQPGAAQYYFEWGAHWHLYRLIDEEWTAYGQAGGYTQIGSDIV